MIRAVRVLVWFSVVIGCGSGEPERVASSVLAPAAAPVPAESQPLAAVAPTEDWDFSSPLNVEGVVSGISVLPAGPAALMLERGDESWVIVGDDIPTLSRRGVRLLGPQSTLHPGAAVTVNGFFPVSAADTAARLTEEWQAAAPPGSSSLQPVDALADGARLAYGVEVTTAAGDVIALGEAP